MFFGINQINLLELFCYIDDFCLNFEDKWQAQLIGASQLRTKLKMSEVLTILI